MKSSCPLRRDELPRVTFRLVNVGFAVVFLASAVLQYNDSDGILWAGVYLAGGCASLFNPVRSATATGKNIKNRIEHHADATDVGRDIRLSTCRV